MKNARAIIILKNCKRESSVHQFINETHTYCFSKKSLRMSLLVIINVSTAFYKSGTN